MNVAITNTRPRLAREGIDPMDRILAIGSGGSTLLVVVLVGALLFHGGVAGMGAAAVMFDEFIEWHRGVKGMVADRLAQTYDIQQEKAKEPPPPPPEEKKEESPPPAKVLKEAPPPPPQAAQAGKVLTAAPDPAEPVDLTGQGFVSGTGTSYAGGVTQAGATGGPTQNMAASVAGTPGGTGTAAVVAPVQAPDRSRPARLLNPERWQRIEFPEEANTDGVDHAVVLLKIVVDAQGSPASVTIVQDPGHGFGRQAKQFALRQKYDVALDRDGRPIPGVSSPRITFDR